MVRLAAAVEKPPPSPLSVTAWLSVPLPPLRSRWPISPVVPRVMLEGAPSDETAEIIRYPCWTSTAPV